MAMLKEIMQRVQNIFHPKYELGRNDYLGKNLRSNDAHALLDFVNDFSDTTNDKLTIIAVGSSTYSLRIRRKIKALNEEYPYLNASTTYNDIDLRIYPEAEQVSLAELEDTVTSALDDLEMGYERVLNTAMGVSYVRYESGSGRNLITSKGPFPDYEAGCISLKAKLETGTPLELILGKEDPAITGAEKIRQERLNNYSFVLLKKSNTRKTNYTNA